MKYFTIGHGEFNKIYTKASALEEKGEKSSQQLVRCSNPSGPKTIKISFITFSKLHIIIKLNNKITQS